MKGPLDGIRVIDCTRVLAGPYCATLLGHLGAEVIKVESFAGDEGRSWPPHQGDIGATFIGLNAGKRSIAVDLKSASGVAVVRDLAATADVVVENFKTGDMESFGLGHDDLRAINPKLIYTSISAFGRTGPKATDPGYEALVQAYSGVMAITGEPNGEPVRCGVSFLDMSTGVMAALATVTALFQRVTTGVGVRVDLSLLGTSMGLMTNQVSNFLQHGVQPARLGSAHPQVVPYQVFATSDGATFVAAGNDNLFRRLSTALDRPEWIDDPRFVDQAGRVTHRDRCVAAVASAVAELTNAELGDRLRLHGVPFSPVNDYASVFAEGQIDALGVIAGGFDPSYGRFRTPALPFAVGDHQPDEITTAPRIGEHTAEILEHVLDYDRSRIADLLASGAVSDRHPRPGGS